MHAEWTWLHGSSARAVHSCDARIADGLRITRSGQPACLPYRTRAGQPLKLQPTMAPAYPVGPTCTEAAIALAVVVLPGKQRSRNPASSSAAGWRDAYIWRRLLRVPRAKRAAASGAPWGALPPGPALMMLDAKGGDVGAAADAAHVALEGCRISSGNALVSTKGLLRAAVRGVRALLQSLH
jgi:hypothetical protein